MAVCEVTKEIYVACTESRVATSVSMGYIGRGLRRKESRSFVVSASGLMHTTDLPVATPHVDTIRAGCEDTLANGGSCIAGPDGEWIVAPVVDEETLIVATLDHCRVREERQNFDPAGHYARPDVTQLTVNRVRQSTLVLIDTPPPEMSKG